MPRPTPRNQPNQPNQQRQRSQQRQGQPQGRNKRPPQPPRDVVHKLSLIFYNSKLRHNPTLRRACEDRHVLDTIIDEWKSEERMDGQGLKLKGISRSDIIHSLKVRWRLIDAKVVEENVIVWSQMDDDDGGESNNAINANNAGRGGERSNGGNDTQSRKAERIAKTIERIRNSRNECEANRNDVFVDLIDFESKDGGHENGAGGRNGRNGGNGHNGRNGEEGREGRIFRIGERLQQKVFIRNQSLRRGVRCTVKSRAACQRGFVIEGDLQFELPPRSRQDSSHSITVSFVPKLLGVIKSIIVFDFFPLDCECSDDIDENESDGTGTKPFSIARYISLRTGDPDDYELLKPTAPYVKKRNRRDADKFADPIRGAKLPGSDGGDGGGKNIGFSRNLKRYEIPPYLGDLAADGKRAEKETEKLFGIVDSGGVEGENGRKMDYSRLLTMDNHVECMQHLLWMEEIQMKVDIRSYDMSDTPLQQQGQHSYKLHIPGLAENRPSVLKGDKILIHVRGIAERNKFEGIVQRTTQENAILSFPPELDRIFIAGMRVDVRFTFSRTTIRTSHQALDRVREVWDGWNGKYGASAVRSMLFPDSITESFPASSTNEDDEENASLAVPLNDSVKMASQLKFFNRDLNEEQRAAVLGILQSVARPRPYLIYGPPGTGKTVTVVESILQTLYAKGARADTRILVCAPSNAATDVVVERLLPYFKPNEMLRLMAYSRDRMSVPDQIIGYTNYDESTDSFVMPNASSIKKFKIVAVTVSYGGRLPNYDILGHFTHVFMDEAGHSIEPEAIACFVEVSKQDKVADPPVIVLTGDPKQLGPIIRSQVGKKFGLEKSLLQRLSEREPYARSEERACTEAYDKRMITKLVQNYRSHPAILKLPNEAFYDGDLLAKADFTRSHRSVKWEHLPTKGFPIIFHGCEGEDQREGNSPSWFNPDEAQLVKMYVDLLVKDTRTNRYKPEEIGIITPYHKQVQKIRMLLKAHDYSDCTVGSVEEFQGSERPVIIISTVRSTVDYIEFDQKYQLGFLSSEKRFNVAITRAQALLIIVGNPFTLENDPIWKSMIAHSIEGGGYLGCDYTMKEARDSSASVVEDVIRGIQSEFSEGENEEEDGFLMVSHVMAQEGPAWRSEE